MASVSRGSWTWRREFAHVAGFAAALLGALLLAGFDRAWWLRQMLTPVFGLLAAVSVVVWALFLISGDEGSAWLPFTVAAVSGSVAVLLRPKSVPGHGGAR